MQPDWKAKSTVARGFLPRQGFAFVLSDMFSQQCRDTGKKAFTLAEVLITLGIIGIVASMTLPLLIQKNQDKVLISATKKTYSNISNALMAAQNDFGVVGDNSLLFDKANTSAQTAEKFSKYFKGAKYCVNKSSRGCSEYYYDLNYASLQLDSDNNTLSDASNLPKIILPDGAVLRVQQSGYTGAQCFSEGIRNMVDSYGRPVTNPDGSAQTVKYTSNACGYLVFDVNGSKKPNQYGRDAYEVIVSGNSVKLTPSNTQHGSKSLINIMTGIDRLEYVNYKKGEKVDF